MSRIIVLIYITVLLNRKTQCC